MIKNYLKTAFRNIKRAKMISVLNILGLAVGMGCGLLIFLFIQHELSFDKFHDKHDQIYRVTAEWRLEGEPQIVERTPAPAAPALLNDYPEIKEAVRIERQGAIIRYQGESFVDEEIAEMYIEEDRLRTLINAFSLLAVFIACLGLLGLASCALNRRTKEIGVRKVLGASVPNIFVLLVKDFTKLVLIANIIALPIAFYAMSRWLQSFVYRISLEWWLFVISALGALVIAVLTVSFHPLKAASSNPADSLRYE
ncbi:MAG: FtsX-like permease family protein [Candidatus Aminicenantaceae bacterium]